MRLHFTKSPSNKHKRRFGHYLNEDEEMVFFTGVSGIFLLNQFITNFLKAIAVTLLIAFVANFFIKAGINELVIFSLIASLIYSSFRYYTTKEGIQYILTNRRIVVQKGFFRVTLHSANYQKISHIEIHQNFFDRFFMHHGKLIVHTAGHDKKSVTLDNLHKPLNFKNFLDKLIHEEKQVFGTHY